MSIALVGVEPHQDIQMIIQDRVLADRDGKKL